MLKLKRHLETLMFVIAIFLAAFGLGLLAQAARAQEMQGLGSGLSGGLGSGLDSTIITPGGVAGWTHRYSEEQEVFRTPEGDVYWIDRNDDGSGSVRDQKGNIWWFKN